jgi:hypothetical protein
MENFGDDDIDKIFKEMFSPGDNLNQERVDAIISIEKVSIDSLIKELIFITQSLSQSIVHINELILNVISSEDYAINEEVNDILGSMYKLSEDFDDCMLEILLEESEIDLDEEDEEDG